IGGAQPVVDHRDLRRPRQGKRKLHGRSPLSQRQKCQKNKSRTYLSPMPALVEPYPPPLWHKRKCTDTFRHASPRIGKVRVKARSTRHVITLFERRYRRTGSNRGVSCRLSRI